jgi:adenosylcobinamide amidohydrolase
MSPVDPLIFTSMDGVTLEKNDRHIYCRFDQPREVVSSAILNGGATLNDRTIRASQFLNLKVAMNSGADSSSLHATPQSTLLDYCTEQGWSTDCVGMMTAASMNSLRFQVLQVESVELLIVITAGLGNARRAGDQLHPDETSQSAHREPAQAGTINIALISNSRFSPAAIMEMITMATEAKCVAMQEANVVSPVSGNIATGTGTDSIAFFNGLPDAVNECGDEVIYCGKHTRLGQTFTRALTDLIVDSINWQDA